MRGLLRAVALCVAAGVAQAGASQAGDGQARKDGQAGKDPARTDGLVVTLRGCVSGSLLKSVQAAPAAGGVPAIGDRYRMVGTKQVRARIKSANKALVDVTGRVKPGPQAVVAGTTMGKTRIGIGVTPGVNAVDQQAPYTPTLDVDTITVVARRCE